MSVEKRDKSKSVKESLRVGEVHMRSARVPPGTATVARRFPRLLLGKPSCHEAFRAGERVFPLSLEDDAQSAPNPFIKSLEDVAYPREGEIVHPPDQDELHLLDDSL